MGTIISAVRDSTSPGETMAATTVIPTIAWRLLALRKAGVTSPRALSTSTTIGNSKTAPNASNSLTMNTM